MMWCPVHTWRAPQPPNNALLPGASGVSGGGTSRGRHQAFEGEERAGNAASSLLDAATAVTVMLPP